MLPPVLHTEKGFTLIEFLVAIVILMIGMLGLLEAVNVAMRQNTGNKMRNDAVVLADQVMSAQRVRSFDSVVASNTSQTVSAGAAFVNYSVINETSDLSGTSKIVTVSVSWRERGVKKQHSLSTVITNEATN